MSLSQATLYTSATGSAEHSKNCVHLRRDRDLALSHDEVVPSFLNAQPTRWRGVQRHLAYKAPWATLLATRLRLADSASSAEEAYRVICL